MRDMSDPYNLPYQGNGDDDSEVVVCDLKVGTATVFVRDGAAILNARSPEQVS